MKLSNTSADVFVPDGSSVADAIERTSHMTIGAHPDDAPIMAPHAILECFGRNDRWLMAVTVTDGASSSRSGIYSAYSDSDMRQVRVSEERKAATLGEYSAAVLLGHTSAAAKDPSDNATTEDLRKLLMLAQPSVVYTHNLADKHDTHVAVALRAIEAIRSLPETARPAALFGCEVWRDLDWLSDDDKVTFDVGAHPNLTAALVGVYDSQIAGGKRYDLAALGRRISHATFSQSHQIDSSEALSYAMDLTPLIGNARLDPAELVDRHIAQLRSDVSSRLSRLSR